MIEMTEVMANPDYGEQLRDLEISIYAPWLTCQRR